MKIAVVYKSNYGTTQQCAAWIAKDLKADLLEHSHVYEKTLLRYDCIVHGGKVVFSDRGSFPPLVEYVRRLTV